MELKITVSDDFVVPSSCAECEFIKVEKNEYTSWDGEVFKCIFTKKEFDFFDLSRNGKDENCPFRQM